VRIAILADIHGNLRALEAVQADLKMQAPDIVVNLGDHVSGPLQAAATADVLMDSTYVQIRGNHDRQLMDRTPAQMGASDYAAYEQLGSRHMAWLQSLPATHMVQKILLCHGSPHDDLEYLLEEVASDVVQLAPPQRIRERLANIDAPIVLCGHTHVPRAVRLAGGPLIVNPGSIGLQAYDDTRPRPHYVETGSPHARYAILDWGKGRLKVNFITLEYDWEATAREAAVANRQDWAHALATGYALRAGETSVASFP
jgi:putative phosphoesterase